MKTLKILEATRGRKFSKNNPQAIYFLADSARMVNTEWNLIHLWANNLKKQFSMKGRLA
jgi:hypothetical protein